MLYKNRTGNAYYIAENQREAMRYEALGMIRVEESTVKAPEKAAEENPQEKAEPIKAPEAKAPHIQKTAAKKPTTKKAGTKNAKKN